MTGRILQTAAGIGSALVLLACGAQAEPVKIRMAYVVPVTNIGSILARKPDLMKNNGKTYTFEALRFQGTPQMNTALAVGEIEIALLGTTTLALAIQNAGMKDLRVFADELRDGMPGRYSNEFSVRKDSPVKTVADMKGKLAMSNGAGSAVDIAIRLMLAKSGLQPKRDYTIVEAPLPTGLAMLKDKKVDLVSNVLPFSENPEMQNLSRSLFTARDAFDGPSYLAFWVAKDSFLKKNRAAVLDFLEDSIRVTRWYIDEKNHAEAVKIATAATKLPARVFDSWLFTKKDYFRDPNLVIDTASLQANMDVLLKAGFIKEKIDTAQYTDMSYVQEAAKRVK